MKTLILILSLITANAYSAPTKTITGKEAIKQILSSVFDRTINGTLINGKSCTMSFLRTGDGALHISISSGVMTRELVAVAIVPTVNVAVYTLGNDASTETSYVFKQGARNVKVALRGFDDISDFDLTVTAGDRAFTCSFQE